MEHHREMTSPDSENAEAELENAEENAGRRLEELEENKPEESSLVQRAKEMLGQGDSYHPGRLAASQALRHKHEHLEAITHLTHQFGGKVLDISTNNCIVEM